MNVLIELLSQRSQKANKVLGAWYNEQQFTLPFTDFLMLDCVHLQVGVFKQFFISRYNIDIEYSHRGYSIAAAQQLSKYEDDFRYNKRDGIYYIEYNYSILSTAPDDYLTSIEKETEYWLIKSVLSTMEWIDAGIT